MMKPKQPSIGGMFFIQMIGLSTTVSHYGVYLIMLKLMLSLRVNFRVK